MYSLIPVIGTVKAGYGALAFEEDCGRKPAPRRDPSSYFYLVVRGDSSRASHPRRRSGALVHKQDALENGDLGVLILRRREGGHPQAVLPDGSNCVVFRDASPTYKGNGHQG